MKSEDDRATTPVARNTITLAATLGYLFDAYAINIYGMTLALIAPSSRPGPETLKAKRRAE